MDGVYFPPKLPGRAAGRSHAAIRHGGGFLTLCQGYAIVDAAHIDVHGIKAQIECERCLGALAKASAEDVAAAAGALAVPRRMKHLPHQQIVDAGILSLLNTGFRESSLPTGCFFTCHAGAGGRGELLIVDAFDDAELLAKALATIERTRR